MKNGAHGKVLGEIYLGNTVVSIKILLREHSLFMAWVVGDLEEDKKFVTYSHEGVWDFLKHIFRLGDFFNTLFLHFFS